MKISENNLCNIVNDLLPLYADDACTESSRQFIEEHIKTCTNCSHTLSLMKQPIDIDKNSSIQAKAVKKATRRLKLRTIIIFVLVIVITLPPAISAVNWYRGDGICFTNIDDIRAGKSVMEMWKTEGFEKMLNNMVPADLYEMLCKEDCFLKKKPEDYSEKEIEGRTYYAYKDIFEDDYVYGTEEYLQNFWYNIITDTLWYYMIPADIYENLEKEYGEDFYKERKSGLDQSVPKKITTEFGDFYFNYDEQKDEYISNKYYRTVDFRDKIKEVYDVNELFYLVERTDILTPELYDYYCKMYTDTVKWDKEYTQYYRNLGLDGFTQQWRSDLLNYMEDYEALELTSYKLTDIYQAAGKNDWNLIFSVEFSNGASGNIYIFSCGDYQAIGGAYPNQRESIKSQDFFYGLAYTAHENYLCSAPYGEPS